MTPELLHRYSALFTLVWNLLTSFSSGHIILFHKIINLYNLSCSCILLLSVENVTEDRDVLLSSLDADNLCHQSLLLSDLPKVCQFYCPKEVFLDIFSIVLFYSFLYSLLPPFCFFESMLLVHPRSHVIRAGHEPAEPGWPPPPKSWSTYALHHMQPFRFLQVKAEVLLLNV